MDAKMEIPGTKKELKQLYDRLSEAERLELLYKMHGVIEYLSAYVRRRDDQLVNIAKTFSDLLDKD